MKVILSANTEWYLYNFRLSLARRLRSLGCEVVLVSPPGRFAEKLQQAGFRWIEWNLGRKTVAPWRELGSLIQAWKVYRREKPDLVHHHTIKPVLYGSLAARLAGVPVRVNSITGRGYVFLGKDRRAGLIKALVMPAYRLALGGKGCGAIFENQGDRQYFLSEKLIKPQQAWLIEGVGVDEVTFTPLPEPAGSPVIVLAARLLWDKGVGELVEAARLLKDTGARVALVGEPDEGNPKAIPLATIESWRSQGLVEWWGWHDDMSEVYKKCHIVALPSYYEGVPTVLLEAASCGRPLVASDIPGCRAVVQDGVNGFLVPVRDAQVLAEALRKLVVDPDLRARMGAAGRALILEKHTQDHVNQATLDVYAELAGAANVSFFQRTA